VQPSRVLAFFALLGVALWFSLSVPEEPPTTFSQTAIDAAVLEMQPALERALDMPFNPPIDVAVVSPQEMAKVLASEMDYLAAEGNERKGIDTWAPLLGQRLATAVMAKVELESSRLNITPRVFARLDTATKGMFGLQTPSFRNVLLLHEMVHVYQMRRIDAPAYFDRPGSVGQLQARGSVIEGHAQYVAQRVAAHLDLDEAFRDLVGVTTGDIEGLPESTRRIIRIASGMQAFPYFRGHQMVERIVRERGYEAAVAAMLETPPPDEIAVVTPARYLPPPDEAMLYERALRRVVRYSTEFDAPEVTSLSSLDLRLAWNDRSLDDLRKDLKSFVIADRIDNGDRALIELYRCRDPESALAFRSVIRKRITAGEIPWSNEPMAIEPDVAGIRLVREAHGAAAEAKPWLRMRAVLLQTGSICIVLRFESAERWDGADRMQARRVHELVHASYGSSPWSGVPRAEIAAAFCAALQHGHWGVRWRAARNLGRLSDVSAETEAAAIGALSDDDPSVRIAALDAFRQWKRMNRIPRSILQQFLTDENREVENFALRIRAD